MTTKSQRIRAALTADIFGMDPASIGYTIRQARKAMGLTPKYIAECMCVSTDDWLKYEQNNKLVPSYVVMKLMMFGMDFWCKNRERFEGVSNDHPVASRHPSTGGELSSQTNI